MIHFLLGLVGQHSLSSLRVVFWNDANGSTFYLKPVGGDLLESHDLVIEDCTVGRNFQNQEFVHIFHLLHILHLFRWFMHEGCCHELEVEEGVFST